MTEISQPNKRRATGWGLGLFAVGLTMEVGGLMNWGGGRWPDMLVSVGAGSLLAGFVMYLEPRLARDVGLIASRESANIAKSKAAEVASEIANERAQELSDRLSKIESVKDIQDRVQMKRKDDATILSERLSGVPEYSDIDAIITDALSKDMFEELWLQCSTDRTLLLRFTRLDPWAGPREYSKPRLFVTLGRTTTRKLLPVGVREDPSVFVEDLVTTQWWADESFEDFYNNFVEDCIQANQSPQGIEFNFAFSSLAASYEVMTSSRNSPANDPLRLSAPLTYLVNDQWAITNTGFGTHALEGLLSGHKYDSWPIAAEDEAGSLPEQYDEYLWEQALFYAERFLHRVA